MTLVEVGILQGTGLAIWSDLFPQGRIIGLDIDLGYFKRNEAALRKAGGFANNNVELHEYDQFAATTDHMHYILGSQKVDIYIDDGHHALEPITKSFKAVMSHLADQAVCFIEDNTDTIDRLRGLVPPTWFLRQHGMIAVIRRNALKG